MTTEHDLPPVRGVDLDDVEPVNARGVNLFTVEERLAVSEASLRLATDAGEVGTWDLDIATDTLVWSDRTKAMFGISPGASCSMVDFYAGLHPDDREATTAAFASALDPSVRATYDVEYRVVGKEDGIVRRVAARGKALFDGAGVCVRAIGTAIDITQRHVAGERLRASEARLAESEAFAKLLLESTSEAFYSVDTSGRTTSCNGAFVRMLGFADATTAIGRRLHGVIHHSHADGRPYPVGDCPIYRAASDGKAAHIVDEFFYRLDGTPIAVDYRAEPIYRDNVLVGAICTISDVTARRAAEAALRELNETLEARVAERTRERDAIWRESRDMLLVVGPNGVIDAVNPAWTATLGYASEDLVGTHYSEFVVPSDTTRSDVVLASVADGPLRGFENRYRHADGSTRDFAWTVAEANGQIYCVGRDVTAERAAAAQLAATEDALRQAQKMEAVGQLTGGIAHDFNNLLQIVIGNLDMLQRALPAEPPRLRRIANNAMAGAQRAATLTARLLAFSRQQPLSATAIDVAELIAGMSDLVDRALGETIGVDVAVEAGLWHAMADPNQLESAILNLAVNARDAMPAGGTLTIAAANRDVAAATGAAFSPGRYVAIRVTDTGAGMDAATASRAFEPFFTTKDVGKGTGLGLAMVYGFVRQSGGDVELASVPGEGTTMTLLLPAAEPSMQRRSVPTTSPPVAARPASILVVEDDPDVRAASVAMLGDLGYRILTAADGPAALAVLAGDEGVDLLFSDIVLPGGLTGVEVAARANALRPHLRVLFTTGYARSAFDGLDARVEVLAKPFTVAALATRVAALLPLR